MKKLTESIYKYILKLRRSERGVGMFVKETKLKKWGNSQGIRIGKEELKELGYDEEEVVFTMIVDKGQIILTPKKKYPDTLEELFADYNGSPLGSEDKLDWGESVGRELL